MNGMSHCSCHRSAQRYINGVKLKIDTTLHLFFIFITLAFTYISLPFLLLEETQISCKVVVVFIAFSDVNIAAAGMVPPSAAMGRGYPGYGAMAPGYPGANPVVGAAYGYGN